MDSIYIKTDFFYLNLTNSYYYPDTKPQFNLATYYAQSIMLILCGSQQLPGTALQEFTV